MSDIYYTHRKHLRNSLDRLDFTQPVKILEFGTGEGSAVVFKEYCDKYPLLQVQSYESDNTWQEEMAAKYSSENYIFNFVSDWNTLLVPENFQDTYDLIFVDQNPWEARTRTINTLKNSTKTILLHDYDFYNDGYCEPTIYVGAGSFFHINYSDTFELLPHTEFYPPTLEMRKKD